MNGILEKNINIQLIAYDQNCYNSQVISSTRSSSIKIIPSFIEIKANSNIFSSSFLIRGNISGCFQLRVNSIDNDIKNKGL